MSEDQLQHEIIMWFSQTYPELRGALFEINNNSNNIRSSMRHRALGRIAGVSDLILHYKFMYGIELKAPFSRHKRNQIELELEWGRGVVSRGGLYIMSSNIDLVKNFIQQLLSGGVVQSNIYDIEQKLITGKKTILF